MRHLVLTTLGAHVNKSCTTRRDQSAIVAGCQEKQTGQQRQFRCKTIPFVLEKMHEILNRNPSNYENKLLWVACCMGFCVWASSHLQLDPLWLMSVQDISVDSITNPTWLQITIKVSKTDQLLLGLAAREQCNYHPLVWCNYHPLVWWRQGNLKIHSIMRWEG